MRRRIVILIARLSAWVCYGLLMLAAADREAMRCHDLGAAVRACGAPLVRFYGLVSLVFLVVTLVLAGRAWCRPLLSEAA